ncbi:hypothetical protein BMS3Abin09_00768 [bacterium BMS3Abin09]|nr:hypothetical protein BMS3Abin09_00768 [bacterium BMS3Abin09]GBE40778.1 hypothetical protein BMS3Bbin09_00664 [bacterium BMS3Bbin09]HDH34747.1 DUF2062 domain-containing protein [Nitrospirota bacterium]HDO67645.1 DUF2062 domain-containing protein [Nitrospirota bacterium]HEW81819.1 DUF2062 domain-containing protein [Nitrospirota bacterium]
MAYFRDKFRAIFQVNEPPHRIALAFAMGVFMGISPLLGLHYIGAVLLAMLFRLNKIVSIIGVSVNNPWTIVPLSTFCVWFGAKLLRIKQVLPVVDWENISLSSIAMKFTDFEKLMHMIRDLWPLLSAFFVGSFIICTISSIASYFIILRLAGRYRKIHEVS